MKLKNRRINLKLSGSSIAVLAAFAVIGWMDGTQASAYTFNTNSNWDVELDTAISYGMGIRAQSQDPMIANNPLQQNNEFKFPKAGDFTSNRLNISSELTVEYQQNFGLDISALGWKDFAYGDKVETNPGMFAPGVPYSALSSSLTGKYGSYTSHFYNLGGELGNAFIFKNFNFGNVPVSVKVGRFTEYWGNAIFSGGQAISYGQSPVDIIKAVDAPGTEVKDLFMPRGQVSVHAQVLPDLMLGFQYAFEYRPNRLPEGGTFQGIVDPLWVGPQVFEGVGSPVRGKDYSPPNVNGNFGVEAVWSPDFLNGSIGLYARQFDDPTPSSPFVIAVAPITNYHLIYAQHERLFGVSLDRNIGTASTGFEVSVRQNTALLTVPAGYLGLGEPGVDPYGRDSARGNLLNVIGNAIYGLPPSPFWQTGSLVGEVAWTHLLQVTQNKALYLAKGYACSHAGYLGGEVNGCATTDDVSLNVVFDPQWLQVFPGVDLDAPMTLAVGVHGNGQTLAISGTGNNAGTFAYSAGINALIKQKYNVKLFYSGYTSPTSGVAHTPNGQPYYASGSGQYMWNDKGQVQLVLSTSF